MFWSHPNPWEKTIAVRPWPETWTLFRWMALFDGFGTAGSSVTVPGRGWNTRLLPSGLFRRRVRPRAGAVRRVDMNRRPFILILLALAAWTGTAAAAEP